MTEINALNLHDADEVASDRILMSQNVELRPDLPYGTAGHDGRPLSLRLYSPTAPGVRPGIVFIHGGGWQKGDAAMLGPLAHDLAVEEYVTASIEYRLSGEARWPAALEDAKCAVRWMRAHAAELGVDAARIAVAGGSAGGYLALMVALTPGRFEGTGGWGTVSSAVQAAVLYNPMIDLHHPSESVSAFLGGQSVTAASPMTYVGPGCPPVLSRVGDADRLTPMAGCAALHRRLDAVGVPNRLEIVPGKGHRLPVHDHDGCRRATVDFLAGHLLPEAVQ
jgi:acetyl esterase/lipase